jgi:hypothetical protein
MLLTALKIAFALPASGIQYDVNIQFDGYLPVLGGSEGKVNADLGLSVKGDGLDDKGNQKAVSDLTSMNLIWNGDKMPFTVDNVRPFFPKTTITYAPNGKILSTDAPDVQLPVRLPGLDVKRFPDITYLPIEFPEEGVGIGVPFKFQKKFGDSAVDYQATVTGVEGSTVKVAVKMTQAYETLEDEAKNLTTVEKDAFYRVTTKVDGEGTFEFDANRMILVKSKLVGVSVSKATEIKSGKSSDRKLTTTLSVTLKK